MASGESSLDSNGSGGGGSHGYLGFSNEIPIRSSNMSPRDYDPMKQQSFDPIMEVSDLRRQIDYYRNQNASLRNKLDIAMQDKQRVECEFDHFKKDGIDFRLFVEQYNDLKIKYSNLRKENEKLVKDKEICQKINEKLKDDCNISESEKKDLVLQIAKTFRQLDMLQNKYDSEKTKTETIIIDKTREINKISSILNELKQESKMTFDERDTVLKENQKLTDECLFASTQIKILEKENKSLKHESECLKQEIESSYTKCESLKNELDHIKSRPEFKTMSGDSWSKDLLDSKDKYEQHELDAANREIEKLKKALDKVNAELTKSLQEIEIAKGRRDWAISEREKIVQERDSIKTLCDELRKERDTAISDLLAAIRDSENIKKQKDEACKEVELLKEILESQTNGNNNNSMSSSGGGNNSNNSANNSSQMDSRWSYGGHDTSKYLRDKNKLETEVIDVDMSMFSNVDDDDEVDDEDYGLILDDSGDELQSNTCNIKVIAVTKDSIFSNKLQKNDIIVRVNDLDCQNVSNRLVFNEIRSSRNRCTFAVKRQKSVRKHFYTTQLNLSNGNNHGISLESGLFISKIQPGSLASMDKYLSVGDRILSINNHSMESAKNRNDALSFLDDNCNDIIIIIGLKQVVLQHHKVNLKPITISTQTEDNYSRSIDFDRNSHFVPTNTYHESSSSFPMTTPTKSTSRLTEMIQKIRGKKSPKSNEAEAIALLDSVIKDDLQSNIPTKDNGVIKRLKNKKSKESKESSNKGMETWPRTNIIELNHNTGTIIHQRKKERPALTTFNAIISDKNQIVHPNPNEDYFNVATPSSSSQKNSQSMSNSMSNRNSNPIPFQHQLSQIPPSLFNRHSVYQLGNNKSVPLTPTLSGLSTLSSHLQKSTDIDYVNHHHRMSLNFTPNETSMYTLKSPNHNIMKNSSQQQNSLDYMLLKSPNSIESVLNSKSPPPIEFTSKHPISRENLEYRMKMQNNQKNVTKYPSDSESLGPDMITSSGLNSNNSISSYSRVYSVSPKSVNIFSQYPAQFQMGHHGHPHQHPIRLSSPPTLPGHNEDSLGLGIYDRYGYESYTPPYHSHGQSIDYPSDMGRPPILREREDIPFGYTNTNFRYEGGTFPRKKEQRLRIPSNPSVTSKGSGVKNSTGSIEHHGSERGSPMPTFRVEILSHGSNANKRNSMPDCMYGQKPNPGDLRRVTIDKSVEPLGITISCNNNGGGIFVSTVTKNSIASQVGLQIGDQLLEICGINMRAATYESASRVLRQCANPITMLVQYSPEKYDGEIDHSSDDQSISHSGSPTPRNSPRQPRSFLLSKSTQKQQQSAVIQTIPKTSTLPSQMSQIQSQVDFNASLVAKAESSNSFNRNSLYGGEDTRLLFIETKKSANLGISLTGGNACGIFVNNVEKDSLAYNAGMRVGDQILEFNGVDLRHVTAEQAALELAKPVNDRVPVVLQYNFKKFKQIKDLLGGGDSFYIRVGFDRTGDLGENELRFAKDEVLLVDDTMIGRGQWRAWKLDEYGTPLKCGRITSQLKVEEELRLQGNISDGDATTRRGSTSARRSFFRRKKHHRSSSRESKELASFSNTQLSCHSDSGMLVDDILVQGYQRVERLDYPVRRPLLVLGPLSDWVVDKLTNDFPLQFKCCSTAAMNCEQETIENMIKANSIVDYRIIRNNHFEVITVKAIKDVCDKNRHCILDIDLKGVEHLQRLQIFPIVLLLRFKSAKQIKEIKDSRFINDKISAKAAKEMYEHSLKLMTDYKHLISAVIPAGVNITHICTQIKDAVEKEQEKILWVPSTSST